MKDGFAVFALQKCLLSVHPASQNKKAGYAYESGPGVLISEATLLLVALWQMMK